MIDGRPRRVCAAARVLPLLVRVGRPLGSSGCTQSSPIWHFRPRLTTAGRVGGQIAARAKGGGPRD